MSPDDPMLPPSMATDGPVSPTGADAARRQRLRLNRVLATAMLSGMGVVFIATHLVADPGFLILLIRAGAEAGMVGGIADWFAVPRLAEVLPVLALGLPLNACTVVSASLLRKRVALVQVSQAEIIAAVVTLPVMLACAHAGFGVWTLVIGSLVGWVVRGAVILAFAPWLPGLRIGGKRAKEMLHFSLRFAKYQEALRLYQILATA